MPDWISTNETEFLKTVAKWDGYLPTNAAALGVSTDEVTAYTTKRDAYNLSRVARDKYVSEGDAIYQTFQDAKDDFIGEMRLTGKEIQSRRTTIDTQRAALDLPIHDTTATAAPLPTTKPVILAVESPQRLTQIIRWADETTPGSKAKPDGVVRAILFNKVGGPPPTGPDELTEIASDNATPYMAEFEAAQAGQTCHWVLCWENSTGGRGPLSATFSWTIPG